MTSRVLVIIIIASLITNHVQGTLFDENACSSTHVTFDGSSYDMFCMGVKNGKLSFPAGTGCLHDNDCEHAVQGFLETGVDFVKWRVVSKSPGVGSLFVLSHNNARTSKAGDVYKFPPSSLSVGSDNQLRAADRNGKDFQGAANTYCIRAIIQDEVKVLITKLVIDCHAIDFMADLEKDQLYVTMVVVKATKENTNQVVSHHELSTKLFRRKSGSNSNTNSGDSGQDTSSDAGHSTSNMFVGAGLITAMAIVLNNKFD